MSTRLAITLLRRPTRIATTVARNRQLSSNIPINSVSYKHLFVYSKPCNQLWRSYGSEKSAEKKEQTESVPPQTETILNSSAEELKKFEQELEVLESEVKNLKEKHDDLLDKYKRALAESENLRVRLTKQIQDAKIFGIQSFCKDLLEVADTLGHATKAVPKEEINSNVHLKNLYEGLTMTKASLLQVFKRNGLEPMDPLNEKFNPNYHEALFQVDVPDAEPNTVIEVTKLGYKLHERCIRPALVGVAKSAQ